MATSTLLNIRRRSLQFHHFLEQRPYLLQVIIFYLLTFLVALPTIPIRAFLEKVVGKEGLGPQLKDFLTLVILGPALETLVFQYGVFVILGKVNLGKNKYLWVMIISSILFGLSHYYSPGYILFAIADGFVLAYAYYFYMSNPSKAYWTTTLVHILHNITVAFMINR